MLLVVSLWRVKKSKYTSFPKSGLPAKFNPRWAGGLESRDGEGALVSWETNSQLQADQWGTNEETGLKKKVKEYEDSN